MEKENLKGSKLNVIKNQSVQNQEIKQNLLKEAIECEELFKIFSTSLIDHKMDNNGRRNLGVSKINEIKDEIRIENVLIKVTEINRITGKRISW